MSTRGRVVIAFIFLAACLPAVRLSDARPHDLAVVEQATRSTALDRITQRRAALDGVVRHRGDGSGVTVYVFDGGIDSMNFELRGRVRAGINVNTGGVSVCNPHGTAVAGAIAGTTVGVAPRVTIVDVNVINCRSLRGSIEGLVAAVRWVIDDHARRGGPAIANWSLLIDSTRVLPEVDAAIERLSAAGLLVVAAAGNVDRDACTMSPSSSRHALVVGASSLVRTMTGGWRDERTPGTAYGDCIDVYAPGDSVLLPGPKAQSYTFWRGTSMAAGFVSGAAAILLQAGPLATPDSVAALLRTAATREVVDERHARGRGRGNLLFIGLGQ